jgi:hypothetical protein
VALVPELFELSVVAGLLPSAMPRQCAAEKACASLLVERRRSRRRLSECGRRSSVGWFAGGEQQPLRVKGAAYKDR